MAALAPLRAEAEKQGSRDFTPLWAGQAASLAREMPGEGLTHALAAAALERLRQIIPPESARARTSNNVGHRPTLEGEQR